MGEAIGVSDAVLLTELQLVGYRAQTVALVEIAPLIRIAWADGCVSTSQRGAIFHVAAREHLRSDTSAEALLHAWLDSPPPDDVFDVSLYAMRAKLEGLRFDLHDTLLRQYLRDCVAVALASDSTGDSRKIGTDEGRVLARILVSLKPAG
jgi:hypothetical protein